MNQTPIKSALAETSSSEHMVLSLFTASESEPTEGTVSLTNQPAASEKRTISDNDCACE